MTYAQLLGSVAAGSHRLGVDTTVWCPLCAAAAVVLLVIAFRLVARGEDGPTETDAA